MSTDGYPIKASTKAGKMKAPTCTFGV